MLKIYGYGDDIITIERDGNPEDELDTYDTIVTIRFDDGTMIEIGYGKPNAGIWFVHVLKQGSAKQCLTICEDEDADIYSDVFEIDAEIKEIIRRPFDGGGIMPELKPVPFCAECKHFEQSAIGLKRRISGCNYYKKLVLAGGYPCEHFERREPLPEPPEEVPHDT